MFAFKFTYLAVVLEYAVLYKSGVNVVGCRYLEVRQAALSCSYSCIARTLADVLVKRMQDKQLGA